MIDHQRVADLAISLAQDGCLAWSPVEGYSPEEFDIAEIAAKHLLKLRRKGYAKEQCRLGFWNKIAEEIKRSEDGKKEAGADV